MDSKNSARNYDMAKLKDIIHKVKLDKAAVGSAPYIEIGDINTATKEVNRKHKTSVAGAVMAPAKSILISKVRPTRGAIAFLDEPLVVSGGFSILVVDEKVCLPEFLYYQIAWNKDFHSYLGSRATGATYPTVKEKDILEYEIPTLPNTDEQERIVKVFKEAEVLNQKRAEADQKMFTVIPELFNNIFGDPFDNPYNWPKMKLRDVSDRFSDGPFGSNLKSSHYRDEGVRVIRLQNIGVGHIKDVDKAYITQEHFEKLSRHRCVPGDVIVATLGDPNLRAMILPDYIPEALNKADCVQIRPKKDIANPEFICWLMNMPGTLKLATSLISGQTRSRISMGRLAGLEVPIPPMKLQDEFAELVRALGVIEEKQKQSTVNIATLFSALLSKSLTT